MASASPSLCAFHNDVANNVGGLVSSIGGVRHMTIDFAQFQHIDNMIYILRAFEEIRNGFAINIFDAILQRFGFGGMFIGNGGMLFDPLYGALLKGTGSM